MKDRCQKIISRFLTVLIIVLAFIVVVLLFKTVTRSDISIFGFKFYYVATESMYPTIKADSLIVVRDVDAEKLKEGDIISFVSKDPAIYGLINTHRIYSVTTDESNRLAFITMGDNNPKPDDYLVYPEEITGKVIFHTMPMKPVAQFLSFAATKAGFLTCVMLPLLFVAGLFFHSFIKEMRAYVAQEEKELQHIQTQKEFLQNEIIDTEHMTPTQAKEMLEQLFHKEIHEITVEDIDTLMKKMRGGDTI